MLIGIFISYQALYNNILLDECLFPIRERLNLCELDHEADRPRDTQLTLQQSRTTNIKISRSPGISIWSARKIYTEIIDAITSDWLYSPAEPKIE